MTEDGAREAHRTGAGAGAGAGTASSRAAQTSVTKEMEGGRAGAECAERESMLGCGAGGRFAPRLSGST